MSLYIPFNSHSSFILIKDVKFGSFLIGDTKPTASGRGGQQVLLSEMLAFAIAFAYMLYHFL